LPPRARRGFEIFSDLVTAATCVALAIFAWPVMTMLTDLDQRSNSANIPMVIPQSALPIGLLLMALLIAVRLCLYGTRHDDTISSREIER
jgi:TRAP-type C4-dicarboxylate transport system permease small subunit